MPILLQKRIYRQDLRSNPKVKYVFGDNYKRLGLGGQAKEMRGEPNAIGVVTKWEPSNRPEAFFSDKDYDEIIPLLDLDLALVKSAAEKGIVVFPFDGIGTGYSDLPNKASRVWWYLCAEVDKLLTKHRLV